MRSNTGVRRPAVFLVTGAILLSPAAAGDATASTKVRFLHAVPGGAGADLAAVGGSGPKATIRGITFGKASEYATAPSGKVSLTLTAGGKKLAGVRKSLADGARYTFVAESGKGGVELHAYRAGRAVPGQARLRIVHAAPEVGRVEMTVGNRKWGTIGFGQDTGYKQARPGTYDIAARSPGKQSVLVQAKGVNAAAGTASTAYTVGSAGERISIVTVQDSVAAPQGSPDTGLGGLAAPGDGTPWLAVLGAALAAGLLGGLVYTRAPLRRGRVRG